MTWQEKGNYLYIYIVYSLLSQLMLPVNSRRKPLFYRYTVHINLVPRIWVTHINSSTTYWGRILPTFLGGSVGLLLPRVSCHRIPSWHGCFLVHFSPCTSAFGIFWGELGWGNWGNNVVNATLAILRHGCVLLKMCNVTAHTLTWCQYRNDRKTRWDSNLVTALTLTLAKTCKYLACLQWWKKGGPRGLLSLVYETAGSGWSVVRRNE